MIFAKLFQYQIGQLLVTLEINDDSPENDFTCLVSRSCNDGVEIKTKQSFATEAKAAFDEIDGSAAATQFDYLQKLLTR